MGSTSQFRINDLTKGAMFIALMAIGANLTAFITIGTVPLTFQSVIAILAGILLGKKLGAFSIIGYIMVGLIGVPVFAGFSGGFQVLASPTLGFLLSFVAIAYVSGRLVEGKTEPTSTTYFKASLIGLLVNYFIGVPYLYYHSSVILQLENIQFTTIAISMGPFFAKDFILALFTASIAPKLKKAQTFSSSMKEAS
ncbi:biotin transporter BioY [Salipaludibacillus agaradhaerens]|uniref:Biotin transporter n=1 Tax=Salipaludibacillus agaradhaerens TaxID=76935 RepID=A0A9Q4FUZ4_SALAG|nr:biotin transporter BioY [Salipaludibacillus agaradhaerens]MCR6095280.1 biotin transporter BioY [Salipaludibacillus agaradhaerens]MCR6115162.1 biotin transporter BioY [Salipaludibacillus agaradhaerens]